MHLHHLLQLWVLSPCLGPWGLSMLRLSSRTTAPWAHLVPGLPLPSVEGGTESSTCPLSNPGTQPPGNSWPAENSHTRWALGFITATFSSWVVVWPPSCPSQPGLCAWLKLLVLSQLGCGFPRDSRQHISRFPGLHCIFAVANDHKSFTAGA